jgi:hypothetical protein
MNLFTQQTKAPGGILLGLTASMGIWSVGLGAALWFARLTHYA